MADVLPSPSTRPRRLGSLGFTLMELLVVALIMAMSMGLFLGYNFRQRDMIELRTTARDVHQFLRASRNHALLDGEDNLGLYHVQEHVLRATLRERVLALPERVAVELDADESRMVVPVSLFYVDGSADRSQVVLRLEDRIIRVVVDPVLGEVNIVW